MCCSSPSSSPASSLEVSCAIIEADGLVLAARRGPGMDMRGKWEFPGGKVSPGESPA
ncbi:MAG: NUDIX domain-containing protein [Thermodesulfobacteriota bacterium]